MFRARSKHELQQDAVQLTNSYPSWFDVASLSSELVGFQSLFCTSDQRYNRPDGGSEYKRYLTFITSNHLTDIYPQLSMALRIFLTLPVSNASCERVMSVLKRVKGYLRNNMTESRLNDTAILAIEKGTLPSLDVRHAITTFAESKARRGALFKKN
jgi:hypothetical protein